MSQFNQQQDADKSIQQIKDYLKKHSSGIIVLPMKPSNDALAAATSLFLGMLKMGKNVSLVASQAVQSDLVGSDKIKTELQTGGDNLVVSFPYQDGSIDKVDYNIQGDKFNLIIVPRKGHSRLSSESVEYSYSGGKIDFIMTVDAPNLNSIGDIYQKNQRQFESSNVINIDRHMINSAYGLINLVSKTISSTSELILKLLLSLKIEIDKDIATNLYSGIEGATNNLTSYSVNADTFEAIAILLRSGAIKKPNSQAQYGQQFGRPYPVSQGAGYGNSLPYASPYGFPTYSPPQMGGPSYYDQPDPFMQQPQDISQGSFQPVQNNFPQDPIPQLQSFEKQAKKETKIEKEPESTEGQNTNTVKPADFLKPKIFTNTKGLI